MGDIEASRILHICRALFDEDWEVSRAGIKALTSLGANASAIVVAHLEQALRTGEIGSIASIDTREKQRQKKRTAI